MSAACQDTEGAIALHISDEELGPLQSRELPRAEPARKAHLLQMAWHLRQRDGDQALALAEVLASSACPAVQGRVALVRAEVRWLQGDLAGAQALVSQALAVFGEIGSAVGLADAHLLQAQLVLDLGDMAGLRQGLAEAAVHALQAGDGDRVAQLEATARFVALIAGDPVAADPDGAWVPPDDHGMSSGLALWHWNLYAQRCFGRTRLAEAIAGYLRAAEHARRTGQVRQAVLALCNVGTCYSNLGDHDAALSMIEQALALVRPKGWPLSLGIALYLAGNGQRMLGRLEAAQAMFDESLSVLAPLPRSRQYALATLYVAELALEKGDWTVAEARFDAATTLAEHARLPAAVVIAQRGRADALRQLGFTEAAWAAAQDALRRAEAWGFDISVVEALQTLASLDTAQAVQHLQRAISLGERVEGFVMPSSVWQDLAAAHARAGDFRAAYEAALKAAACRDAEQNEQATHRALALAVRHETEQARAEGQRLRERAAAEERKSQLLAATNVMMARLGAIGQQITAQLDLDQVFGAIYAHLRSLLDLQHLSIWLLDDNGETLRLRFGTEEGRLLHSISTSVDNPASIAARCVREGREILHHAPADAPDAGHMPGTLRTRTSLFGPLRVRDRLIGVLSIQSASPQAYGAREQLIFGTLCAYGAIALDNAHTHHELQQARRHAELATQHKSDFLANISHDLRTPLAALQGYLETLLLKSGQLDEVTRQRYLATALAQTLRTTRLAQQVLDLARLETGAVTLSPERFSLADLAQDVVQKLELAAAGRAQTLRISVRGRLPTVLADIAMIERVLTNLLDNAIQHTPTGTRIDVALSAEGEDVCVEVMDTGPGIDLALRQTLFQRPASNRRPHRPGSGGLGLLIVKRMLQQHGRDIALVQRPGYATAFSFSLPVVSER